jgi:hypothetical protein
MSDYLPVVIGIYIFVSWIVRANVVGIDELVDEKIMAEKKSRHEVELFLTDRVNELEGAVKGLSDEVKDLGDEVKDLALVKPSASASAKQAKTFQSWAGTFDYTMLGRHHVEGYVEVLNTAEHTKEENEAWIMCTDNSQRDKYLEKLYDNSPYRTITRPTKESCYMEWVGWGASVICRVNVYEGRDMFSRAEQAAEKAPKIEWKRQLISS